MVSKLQVLSDAWATRLLVVTALSLATIGAAEARPARCITTDEGNFACDFRTTDRDGSFQISAPGKPTYLLTIEGTDVAFGFVNLGGRNTPLPGRYLRSKSEPRVLSEGHDIGEDLRRIERACTHDFAGIAG